MSEVPLSRLPHVDGVLSAEQVADTAKAIAAMQEPWGAVPWTTGEHVDIWNHVEAAMAMLAGGQVEAAERAYEWVPTMQRADGSWPMKIVGGVADDERGEVNMSAYFAVGLWHHWLMCRDIRFVARHWPSVRAGLDFVVSLQQPFGGIQWTPVDEFCLLTGNSSIYHSLRAGLADGTLDARCYTINRLETPRFLGQQVFVLPYEAEATANALRVREASLEELFQSAPEGIVVGSSWRHSAVAIHCGRATRSC